MLVFVWMRKRFVSECECILWTCGKIQCECWNASAFYLRYGLMVNVNRFLVSGQIVKVSVFLLVFVFVWMRERFVGVCLRLNCEGVRFRASVLWVYRSKFASKCEVILWNRVLFCVNVRAIHGHKSETNALTCICTHVEDKCEFKSILCDLWESVREIEFDEQPECHLTTNQNIIYLYFHFF